ncbi:MAG: cadherin domain-containing protein [Candidatus Nanoarchaeia archaeon]
MVKEGDEHSDLGSDESKNYLGFVVAFLALFVFAVFLVSEGINSDFGVEKSVKFANKEKEANNAITGFVVIPSMFTVYIDPTYNGANGPEDGSINAPFNSWTDFTIQNGGEYLQKRGTTYSSSTQIFVNSKNNVAIGVYGVGARPLFNYTGTGYAVRIQASNNILFEGFEVNGNGGAHSLVGVVGTSSSYLSGVVINDCVLHNAHNANNAGFGIHASYSNGLKILNTTIHNVAVDGMYMRYTPNVEIGHCNVYDINRRYFVNPNQLYSSGDGIQLDGYYNGFHIHHTIINRTNGAGNKFNLILASAGASINATGILEYNTFINDANVAWAVHIEHGRGIVTRYNTFMGSTLGLRLGGAYTSNNLIYGNLFYNSVDGLRIGYTYPAVGPAVNTSVFNNVFYNVSQYHMTVDRASVVAKNNIHLRPAGVSTGVALYSFASGSWVLSNNLYGDNATAGTPGTGANAVIGDPLFVNAAGKDFHLQSTSPAINAGANAGILFDREGVSIPQGSAPDIGAYEYAQSVLPLNREPIIDWQSFYTTDNFAVGATVGTVAASDLDTDQSITYSIIDGNINNVFEINPVTGVITVAGRLNSGVINVYYLVVRVSDNGSPSLYSDAIMDILVSPISKPDVVYYATPTTSISGIYVKKSFNRLFYTVNFVASDDQEVTTTYYKVGTGSWKTGTEYTAKYTKPIEIVYYSVDNTGNVETQKSVIISKENDAIMFT